jgi:WD40-like Beta Propeller Repeat
VKGVALGLVVAAVVLVTAGESASRNAAGCKPVAVTGTAFSADSKWVAVARQRACDALSSLLVMRVDGRSRRTVGKSVLDWSWAPKGDRIAFTAVGETGSALVVAAPSGRRLKNVPAVTSFMWAPSGRELAASRRIPEDVVAVPLAGSVRHLADASLGTFRAGHALEWAPDGRRVLFTTAGDGSMLSIRVVSRAGGDEREVARGRSPDWSPSGGRILFDRGAPAAPAWATIQPDGGDLRGVGPPAGRTPEWEPSGRWLSFEVSQAGTDATDPVAWIDAPSGDDLHALGPGIVLWRPSGGRMALTRKDGSVTLVDADGSDRVELPVRGTVAWSPQGKRLVVSAGGMLRSVPAGGGSAKAVAKGDRPAWSPNGSLLAFARRRSCGDDAYTVRLSPRRVHRLVRCG